MKDECNSKPKRLFLDKIKSHPQYSTYDKTELGEIKNQLKTIALPRAEKLKQYIKGIFQTEKEEYIKKKEEERLKNVQKNDEIKPSAPNVPSKNDIHELKKQYDIENEKQFNKFKDLELNSNRDKIEVDNKSVGGSILPPSFDRNLKPKAHNQANNYNLRTVYLPNDLIKKFLDVSAANTLRNVETCGILAGKLAKNEFVISHCIIPKQTGSSDTCSTEHEYELFDAIDNLNLITLGWIHTHPSQTSFLSSIDLHTQLGYQIMIPEAIAIVCAPSYNENRIFILVPDYGVKQISECKAYGFHPHQTNPPLFEECDHVVEDNKINVSMIDLRMISKFTK